MAGVIKFKLDPVAYVHGTVVGNADYLACSLNSVFFFVEGSPFKFFSPFVGLLSEVFGVPGLDIGRIHHDEARDIPARGGGVNIPLIALFYEQGKKAAVIVVAVGQDDSFDPVGGDTEAAVFPVRLGPAALKGPAVDKITFAVDFKYVFGTGYFLSGAKGIKIDVHGLYYSIMRDNGSPLKPQRFCILRSTVNKLSK
jgi:hypothetical protein